MTARVPITLREVGSSVHIELTQPDEAKFCHNGRKCLEEDEYDSRKKF
jgi:hypothetical protein